MLYMPKTALFDSEEAVFDGAFHESLFQSAPYFTVQIDGIEWLNAAY